MPFPRSALSIVCVLALPALSSPVAAQAQGHWTLSIEGDLSAFLDCLEGEERTLISAHRGGPSPGLPENAIETMDAVLAATPAIMEVDVAASSDGVLFLMHDDTLDRTTTGNGEAAAQDWASIAALKLKDADGWVTPYAVPKLQDALRWAKGRTVMQIDFKRSAPYEDVIAMIRAEEMAQNVILIAYSVAAAKKLHDLAPEMLISLSIERPGALAEAEAAGIAREAIVAFTGIRLPRPNLYAELDKADVEVIFGTLGGSRSIDKQLDRFGIDARYAELGERGVDIIATDRPRAAARALADAGRLPEAGQCGVSRESLD
ncbi:glycerophosphodiester phosphodiesterase family protein [Alterisphingorhabdus coralli]|uniref:Glycerophosphodiester phosphodiesterase family protein n=1 Tax=Alterisphingorhabdus coralli TaxID=3071408 RepID=A0AA97I0N3_9SPHN|nr:glycerophosphodiester phosphodiesterase family protein [Parasphingorhabdus sp. SCSIO 66989]WOE74385.1 glycerophosphodiester phosphodiesterase family protein [Parasphingorhabdus sp. SCSIO 66989]